MKIKSKRQISIYKLSVRSQKIYCSKDFSNTKILALNLIDDFHSHHRIATFSILHLIQFLRNNLQFCGTKVSAFRFTRI